MDTALIKGIIIGFSIAAPVGAIGVLCIRRTLAYGWECGFFSGLGAATADAIYGSIAALGITVISDFLIKQVFWLQFIGGIFLLYLGIKTFLSKPREDHNSEVPKVTNVYVSTLFLTITNPMTIVSFTGIFAGVGIASTNNYKHSMLLVLGVFLGSVLWWVILSTSISIFRNKIGFRILNLINKISGIIIIVFAMVCFTKII
ncbi:LysE family translocator [Clostridium rectalis]|uniref:LysE family translocator n=1 Tax=Clostridium rectalis TaxID=2040295 RepID=UPI000F63C165|nr:LysE family transporter [Clostridium rectalis]